MKKATALLFAAALLAGSTASVSASTDHVKPVNGDYDVHIQDVKEEGHVHEGHAKVNLSNTVTLGYNDLADHYAKDSVHRLVKMGFMANKSEAYKPSEKMKRSEAKALIEKVLGKSINDANKSNDEYVRRAEVAEWIAQVMPPSNTGIAGGINLNPFTDLTAATESQQKAAELMYKLGFMVGDGQGHFSPDHGLMKGDAAILAENILARSLQSAKKVEFERVTGDLPETVYTVVQENKTVTGTFRVVEGDYTYVIITGGEVPDASFSVEIESLDETDAGVFVKANLKEDAGDAHAQVVSFPYQVLKIKENKKAVYLLDSNE
ncbi:protease complex subunit PrcB family protein [Tumebacillus sp. DT12]|uniref:Protease complex subunit PrcB family protein n=1 Tax=Tumebacillus lacus TaxID=2995335 RepID=A0ABT3WVS0_9BACL|nr:protease complex subunit PrcB family protein [Tumebacillus lacus]MCX7568696.1 protease complex subunit PrcB family protein [Tumebacillus lacus]